MRSSFQLLGQTAIFVTLVLFSRTLFSRTFVSRNFFSRTFVSRTFFSRIFAVSVSTVFALILLSIANPVRAQAEEFGGTDTTESAGVPNASADEAKESGKEKGKEEGKEKGKEKGKGGANSAEQKTEAVDDAAERGHESRGDRDQEDSPQRPGLQPEPRAPLFPEPSDEAIYPDAPLDDAPPGVLDAAGKTAAPREGEPEKGEISKKGSPSLGTDSGTKEPALGTQNKTQNKTKPKHEKVPKGGASKDVWANPQADPAQAEPPDGWGNWAGAALQYGVGLCAACGCCGSSGVVGGIALAAGIVIPGGSLIFGPLVGCLGCVSILGAPGVGTSAALWLREWLGIWRGPWLLTLGAAYVVELLGVAVIAAGAIGASVLLAGFVASVRGNNPNNFFSIAPGDEWDWPQAGAGAAVFVSSFVAGLLWAILVPAAAATLTYQFSGEQKHSWDIGFRMPGLFSPNHPDEPIVHAPDKGGHERNRARPEPEPASMRF